MLVSFCISSHPRECTCYSLMNIQLPNKHCYDSFLAVGVLIKRSNSTWQHFEWKQGNQSVILLLWTSVQSSEVQWQRFLSPTCTTIQEQRSGCVKTGNLFAQTEKFSTSACQLPKWANRCEQRRCGKSLFVPFFSVLLSFCSACFFTSSFHLPQLYISLSVSLFF